MRRIGGRLAAGPALLALPALLAVVGTAAGLLALPAATALAGVPLTPVAVDDGYGLDEDSPTTVVAPGVLSNDTSAGCAAPLDVSALEGTLVSFSPTGAFEFAPNANFHGETSFTYGVLADAIEGCPGPHDAQATVTFTVNPVNDAPTAQGDAFQFVWRQTLTIAGPGVLGNDGDIDGDSLTAVKVTDPVHGVLTLAANGGFSYTAASAACPGLADAFSYRAFDGQELSPARSVILNPAPLPCPTATQTATPTPAPTASPEPEATPSPEPSPSPAAEPSPTEEALATAVPTTASPSPRPSATAAPSATADTGGPSLPVLLVLVLFGALLAFGAAYAIPRWLRAQGGGAADDDSYDPRG